MTEVIHGLVSGLIWSAILGTCLIAFAAVLTAMVPARARVRSDAAGTTRALGVPLRVEAAEGNSPPPRIDSGLRPRSSQVFSEEGKERSPELLETLAPPPGIIVAWRGGVSSSFPRGRYFGRRETCPARSGR
jgi:hypothetical protein